MAVIKADAYGDGAVAVAEALSSVAPAFAIARSEEALELRTAEFRSRYWCWWEAARQCVVEQSGRAECILYVTEHGCRWRSLPKRFGNWHTMYTRMNRWAKNGVLDRVFCELQHQGIIRVEV